MPTPDDQEILNLIKSADTRENDKAFRYLYQTYFELIEKNILLNNGENSDAEDIFQDTLIVLFHQVKKDQLTLTSSLKTYLYSISRNLWLKRLRKANRVVKLTDALQQYVNIEESHFKTIEANEQTKMISKYLDHLNEGCKDILMRYYFDKMKMADIAEIMGLANEQVAKNKKANCMKKLKSLIKKSTYFKQ